MKKIKIERDYSNEQLFIGTKGYIVGWFYIWVDGSYNNHAYQLEKLERDQKKKWILFFPEGISIAADSAPELIERIDQHNFRRCDCKPGCKGWVLKEPKWDESSEWINFA